MRKAPRSDEGEIELTSYRPSAWNLRLARASGRVRRVLRFRERPSQGWYERSGGEIVAIYREREQLFFRAGEREWALGPNLSTRWSRDGGSARFELFVDGASVFSSLYPIREGWLDRRDPSFEPSQNDFFLALHELVAAPSTWSEAFRGES